MIHTPTTIRTVVLRAAGGPEQLVLQQVAALHDGGWPPPAIDSVFALEEAASAFERSMAAGKRGKVVLEVAR